MSKPNEQEKTDESTKVPDETDSGANQSAEQPKTEQPPEKSFTQSDVDKAVAKALKDAQKKAADAEAKAKLSEEERTKAELADVRRENQVIKAESLLTDALKTAGAKSPKLLFNAVRGDLEFKDGKLTNLTELVEDLKTNYPEQFGEEKPKQGIDAGAGKGNQPPPTNSLDNQIRKALGIR